MLKRIKRYFSYMGRYLPLYWLILNATLIIESGLQVLYSYINKQTLNAVEYHEPIMFRRALFLCTIVVVFKCLFPYLRYFEIKLVRRIVFEIKIELFHKLMKLDMRYYEKSHSGEALKTLNWDANSLKDSYFSHVYWVLGKITLGASSLIAMMIYSRILAVISLVICLITVFVSIWLNNEMKKSARRVQESIAKLANYLSNILSGFSALKMYAGSSIVIDCYKNENKTSAKQESIRVKKAAVLEMLAFLLGILGSFGTIIVGVYLVSNHGMDYGTVMAVVTLQLSFSNTMQRFGSSLAAFTTSLVKADRVFDFLELECEEEEQIEGFDIKICEKTSIKKGKNENILIGEKVTEKALNEKKLAGEELTVNVIEIDNLDFSYDSKIKLFEGFRMDIDSDEKVILIGESGCGKSTLLKLLLHFYPVKDGQIKIYGRDINSYPVKSLRDIITYIPQESYLFEGTIAENIAYGSSGSCSLEDIIKAAELAYADEFIGQMKEGYDTYVSSGGNNLSGGQRQRIAIARAFLKNSPILLMDEPSSALDSQSEQMVYKALRNLMRDRVVLMVTHRKSGSIEFDREIMIG